MKKIIALITLVAILTLCVVSCGPENNDDPVNIALTEEGVNFVFYLLPDASGKAYEAAVVQWLEETNAVTIPDNVTYNGHVYPITTVGLGQGITGTPSNINSVVFGANVKVISENAFTGCDLINVTFNEGLERIESGAFSFGGRFKEVKFPSTLKFIGSKAFSSIIGNNETDGGLERVFFNAGIETIEDSAFNFCTDVSLISIPSAFVPRIKVIFPHCERVADETVIIVNP